MSGHMEFRNFVFTRWLLLLLRIELLPPVGEMSLLEPRWRSLPVSIRYCPNVDVLLVMETLRTENAQECALFHK